MTKRFLLLCNIFIMTLIHSALAQKTNFNWKSLPSIPDQIGFAGSFAGTSNGALLVLGGANFPDGGAPWAGSKKVWTDQIFALENEKEGWKLAGKLPHALGYGASANWGNNLIIIGGSNEYQHFNEVWELSYQDGKINLVQLPSLPSAIANTAAAVVGSTLYVAGGIKTATATTTEANFWSMDLLAKNKAWKVLPTWPGPSRMLNIAGAQDGAFYLFSGVELVNGQRRYLNDAYRYKPANGWEKIADLPFSVAAAASPAFTQGDGLVIFGGDNGEFAPKAAELKENHPGFSTKIIAYHANLNQWNIVGEIFTAKKTDAIPHPNQSIWAPVTTTLTLWKGNVVLPGGEVRPATRTPRVLMAIPKPINRN